VPRDFPPPPLVGVGGIELVASLTPRAISAHAVVVMQRSAPATATAPTAGDAPAAESILPAFPFKGLDWFGGKAEKKANAASEQSPADAKKQAEELPEPGAKKKDQ
jgi:hypothetical protein